MLEPHLLQSCRMSTLTYSRTHTYSRTLTYTHTLSHTGTCSSDALLLRAAVGCCAGLSLPPDTPTLFHPPHSHHSPVSQFIFLPLPHSFAPLPAFLLLSHSRSQHLKLSAHDPVNLERSVGEAVSFATTTPAPCAVADGFRRHRQRMQGTHQQRERVAGRGRGLGWVAVTGRRCLQG